MQHPCGVKMQNHLRTRQVPDHVKVYHDEETAVWLCWNLSGQLTGYQEYKPNAPKQKRNVGRYKTQGSGMFGLEYLNYRHPYLFICEGFFEACMFLGLGLNAVAVFGNNPLPIKEQLNLLPFKKIAVLDNDKASENLKEYANEWIRPPKEFKDLNEMPEHEFFTYLVDALFPSRTNSL